MLCLVYKIKSCSIDDNNKILISFYSVNVDKMSPRILPKIIKKFSRENPRESIIYAKLDSIRTLDTLHTVYGIMLNSIINNI